MRTLLDKLKLKAEFVERSYFQWTLIRSLAFGERDWIVLCSVMFLMSKTRDFLTVPGVTGFILGVMFLGPVFGILIQLVSKLIYFRLKKKKQIPQTLTGLKLITWIANGLCFPVILLTSWQMFNLFYESYDSLKKSILDSMHF